MDIRQGATGIVLIKSFPNDPIVRYVFEESNDCVKLCSEEGFRQWRGKGITPVTVKCPKSRVYSYDPDLYTKLANAAYSIEDGGLLNTLWEHAQPLYDNSNIEANSNAR